MMDEMVGKRMIRRVEEYWEGKKRRETGKERGNVSANVSVC